MYLFVLQAKHVDDALTYCNKLLTQEPENAEALCDRADAFLLNEQFEEGLSVSFITGLHWLLL